MQNRRTPVRAALADQTASVLEAGTKAAFGAAAVLTVCVSAASMVDALLPRPAPLPDAGARTDTPVAPFAPIFAAEPEALAMTRAPLDILEEVTPVSLPLSQAGLPPVAQPITVGLAVGDSDVAYALRVTQPSLFANAADEVQLGEALRTHAPASANDRLAALADDIASSYQAPGVQQHDVALFVASDDEAVSWSLSQASPNYGGLAYQENGVELGNIAAGVSLTMEDVRISAAYVERDMDMRLGRGLENRDQRYAGVVLTLQR